MYLEMAKYTVILLVLLFLAGALLYALIKRFGLPGIIKGALGGMGAVGKGLLVFFDSELHESKDEDQSLGMHSSTRMYDADAVGVGSGFRDKDGNTYI